MQVEEQYGKVAETETYQKLTAKAKAAFVAIADSPVGTAVKVAGRVVGGVVAGLINGVYLTVMFIKDPDFLRPHF